MAAIDFQDAKQDIYQDWPVDIYGNEPHIGGLDEDDYATLLQELGVGGYGDIVSGYGDIVSGYDVDGDPSAPGAPSDLTLGDIESDLFEDDSEEDDDIIDVKDAIKVDDVSITDIIEGVPSRKGGALVYFNWKTGEFRDYGDPEVVKQREQHHKLLRLEEHKKMWPNLWLEGPIDDKYLAPEMIDDEAYVIPISDEDWQEMVYNIRKYEPDLPEFDETYDDYMRILVDNVVKRNQAALVKPRDFFEEF